MRLFIQNYCHSYRCSFVLCVLTRSVARVIRITTRLPVTGCGKSNTEMNDEHIDTPLMCHLCNGRLTICSSVTLRSLYFNREWTWEIVPRYTTTLFELTTKLPLHRKTISTTSVMLPLNAGRRHRCSVYLGEGYVTDCLLN